MDSQVEREVGAQIDRSADRRLRQTDRQRGKRTDGPLECILYIYIYTYVFIYIYICVYIYISANIYIYIYIYIHTYLFIRMHAEFTQLPTIKQ